MVALYTFKYILKYAVNYLIMIDRIVDKKYIRSTDETMCIFFLKLYFHKSNSANVNKSPSRIRIQSLSLQNQYLNH